MGWLLNVKTTWTTILVSEDFLGTRVRLPKHVRIVEVFVLGVRVSKRIYVADIAETVVPKSNKPTPGTKYVRTNSGVWK